VWAGLTDSDQLVVFDQGNLLYFFETAYVSTEERSSLIPIETCQWRGCVQCTHAALTAACWNKVQSSFSFCILFTVNRCCCADPFPANKQAIAKAKFINKIGQRNYAINNRLL
jgi:hypothetical protein